jgi:hypothetical protein
MSVQALDTFAMAHHELDSCENELFRVTEVDAVLKTGRY